MKYDLSIMSLSSSEEVVHEIINCGTRNTGISKIMQIWLKKFLGNDCGNIIELSGGMNNADNIELRVMSGLIDTNDYIKNMQSGKNIPDNERFKSCTLKSLDINAQTSLLNISLIFETEDEIVELSI